MTRSPMRPRRSVWIDLLLSALAVVLVHAFLVTLPAYLVDRPGTETALHPATGAVTPVEAERTAAGGRGVHQAPAAPRS